MFVISDLREHRYVVSNASSSSPRRCTVTFTPAAWGYFRPTWIDVSMYLGTFGLFFTLFLLFLRFVPMIAISEIMGVSPAADPHAHDTGHGKEAH